MRKCSQCGQTTTNPAQKFCEQCGAALPQITVGSVVDAAISSVSAVASRASQQVSAMTELKGDTQLQLLAGERVVENLGGLLLTDLRIIVKMHIRRGIVDALSPGHLLQSAWLWDVDSARVETKPGNGWLATLAVAFLINGAWAFSVGIQMGIKFGFYGLFFNVCFAGAFLYYFFRKQPTLILTVSGERFFSASLMALGIKQELHTAAKFVDAIYRQKQETDLRRQPEAGQ